MEHLYIIGKNRTGTIYRKIAAGLTDWLFPRRCPVCGEIVAENGSLICMKCVPMLSPVRQPVCKKCGKELISDREEYCMDCRRHIHSFTMGRALFQYNAAAARSMAAIKYKNRREYLDFYAQAMAYRYREQVERWKPEVLIPIPVHPARYRSRGFNQADELARRLTELWGIPTETGLLLRKKRTVAQKKLTPEERLKNLQKAFAAADRQDQMPRTVLLIDDIYTTGSTMEACSRVLLASGVEKVYFLTVCIGYGK